MRMFSRIFWPYIITSLLTTSIFGNVVRPANVRLQKNEVTAQDIPQDMLITLERTRCYGMCPDYKIRRRGQQRAVDTLMIQTRS